ncbi:hypothetical protein FRACYDRAFT_269841 [Fragilariopsis cylindrus CCMP1102]|uniref:Uncharacterized protein n=1 Tax=Fragilariopsis cylindrus CCMP1102 TaxID=635003 RepID=A0A1E7F5T9_9STRA|nr:hypothetical protein FRACYDRAFT_269841 [Fragilariopsis cylindrus CCMP1102]|eukprot:OEU13499.1 hypothetical protein FRACYDRAFT_269841 [Fragilariopsis cylindrus CCMP1102]
MITAAAGLVPMSLAVSTSVWFSRRKRKGKNRIKTAGKKVARSNVRTLKKKQKQVIDFAKEASM